VAPDTASRDRDRPSLDDYPITWWMSDPQTWDAWLAGHRAGRVRGMTPYVAWPGPLARAARRRELRERPGLTPEQIRDRARESWGWPCLPAWRDGRLDWANHRCTRECERRRQEG
jgi:hypothetical protein